MFIEDIKNDFYNVLLGNVSIFVYQSVVYNFTTKLFGDVFETV